MADGETTLALTGNTYVAQPISGYRNERFLKVVELLQQADATTTNLECAIQDGKDWPAYTAGMGAHATYMAGHPSMLDELKFLGVNSLCAAIIMSRISAENGILTMIGYLKRAGMPYAGIGASLTEASEACYYDTPSGAGCVSGRLRLRPEGKHGAGLSLAPWVLARRQPASFQEPARGQLTPLRYGSRGEPGCSQ